MGGRRHFPRPRAVQEMGDLGFLGLGEPVGYRGQGLGSFYALVMAEGLATSPAAACRWPSACRPTSATPALARFGLRGGHARVFGAVDRRDAWPASASPKSAQAPTSPGSRPRRARTAATSGQWRRNVDDERHAGRLDVPPCQHLRRSGAQKQIADLPADEDKGVEIARKLDKLGMRSSDTAQIFSTTCACRSTI